MIVEIFTVGGQTWTNRQTDRQTEKTRDRERELFYSFDF